MEEKLEVWLRGPVDGVSPLLQPACHALMQASEEVHSLLADFPEHLLWERPAGVASVGFHLRHLTGVIDRLFTYARGDALDEQQMRALRSEAYPDDEATPASLALAFQQRVDAAVDDFRKLDPTTLLEFRGVGRARLPSTALGLYFHAAEHVQRHVGQLLVTAKVLKER
jgi:uncharacterized damage-inducible protein DinB